MSEIPSEMVSILGGGHVKEDQKVVFRLEQRVDGVAEVSDQTDELIEVKEFPIGYTAEEYAKVKLI
jgi:hypothetical protein